MSSQRAQDTKDNAGSAEPQDKHEPGTTDEAPQWRSHIGRGTNAQLDVKYSLGQEVYFKEGRSKTGPWTVKQVHYQLGAYDIAKGSSEKKNVPEDQLSLRP